MHTPFPKIGQFRDVISHIKQKTRFVSLAEDGTPIFNPDITLPKLSFEGTVKLHGTNAAVSRNPDGSIHFQSRERIITPMSDNAGFALWASTIDWTEFLKPFAEYKHVVVFGEWCGGNIQASVALNKLPKMFVIFKVLVDGEWLRVPTLHSMVLRIYNIRQFPTFNVEVDFENPAAVQSRLVELTEAVEAECPVAKALGVSGIGEGIVWTCDTDNTLVFKVKGDKHSASKVKTLAAIDPELVANTAQFIENTVTENRLRQGLEKVTLDIKSVGEFIRWVYNDIITEEADVILASGLNPKNIGGLVAVKAKKFFFEALRDA